MSFTGSWAPGARFPHVSFWRADVRRIHSSRTRRRRGVSFQSVNSPIRYLRHCGYDLRLDVNGGTSASAGDAMLRRTAGLAGPPGRPSGRTTSRLSHHALKYTLRIDPVTTAPHRSDATCSIGC
ncbi:AbfB domain-containing protein [Streptomyces europaeiscabiei]|uniref:AbfB domain-containing protein n=1 Tax=Streptomyces europaeiscabiei TaxID=146819 RepID=UPI00099F2FBE